MASAGTEEELADFGDHSLVVALLDSGPTVDEEAKIRLHCIPGSDLSAADRIFLHNRLLRVARRIGATLAGENSHALPQDSFPHSSFSANT